MIRWMSLMLAGALLTGVLGLDEAVKRETQRHRSPLGDRVMQACTDLGRRDVVAGGLLALAILDPAGPTAARVAVAALVGTNVVVEALKLAVGRTRPDGDARRSNSSFPSSHAANAFCLAFVLLRRWRRAGLPGLLLAGAVSASRIYLNRHFLSDVVVGFAVGLAVGWLTVRMWPGGWPRASAGERGSDGAGERRLVG